MVEDRLYRLKEILGDPNATPPIQPLIPVSKTTWHNGVLSGRYPLPLTNLGKRISAYRGTELRAVMNGTYQRTVTDQLAA